MADNLAYKEKPREELLDGKIYMMESSGFPCWFIMKKI